MPVIDGNTIVFLFVTSAIPALVLSQVSSVGQLILYVCFKVLMGQHSRMLKEIIGLPK